jgi:hypothetical protein
VNGRFITQNDFDDEAARRPGMSAEEVMNELVTRVAMLIRAEESGVGDTAAFRRERENKLIAEWLATAYNRERDAVTVSEEELQSAYEARMDMFRFPPMPRFAVLYRKGRDTAELAAALDDAVALFEADREAATNNGRLPGFGKIAADHSEDAIGRYRGGDIGWVGEDTLSRVPETVLAAGRLLAPGEIAEPVAAGDGVYVIMKTDERAARLIPFNEAAPALRSRVRSEKLAALDARFKEGLMRGLDIVHKNKPAANPQPLRKPDAPPAFPQTPVE